MSLERRTCSLLGLKSLAPLIKLSLQILPSCQCRRDSTSLRLDATAGVLQALLEHGPAGIELFDACRVDLVCLLM